MLEKRLAQTADAVLLEKRLAQRADGALLEKRLAQTADAAPPHQMASASAAAPLAALQHTEHTLDLGS